MKAVTPQPDPSIVAVVDAVMRDPELRDEILAPYQRATAAGFSGLQATAIAASSFAGQLDPDDLDFACRCVRRGWDTTKAIEYLTTRLGETH